MYLKAEHNPPSVQNNVTECYFRKVVFCVFHIFNRTPNLGQDKLYSVVLVTVMNDSNEKNLPEGYTFLNCNNYRNRNKVIFDLVLSSRRSEDA